VHDRIWTAHPGAQVQEYPIKTRRCFSAQRVP
jgi:hypothetical protein